VRTSSPGSGGSSGTEGGSDDNPGAPAPIEGQPEFEEVEAKSSILDSAAQSAASKAPIPGKSEGEQDSPADARDPPPPPSGPQPNGPPPSPSPSPSPSPPPFMAGPGAPQWGGYGGPPGGGSLVNPALLGASGATGSVDARMYEQVEKSRARISRRLQEAERANEFLREVAEARQDETTQAAELLREASQEISSAMRLARRTTDAVRFGVDRRDMLQSVHTLMERLEVLNDVMARGAAAADNMRAREIPVSWESPASEVKVMGSFDEWSSGVELAPDFIEDSVMTRFTGTLKLRPGKYHVKFLIDGEWRLAPDWPMEQDAGGNDCNVVVVDETTLGSTAEATKAMLESTPPAPLGMEFESKKEEFLKAAAAKAEARGGKGDKGDGKGDDKGDKGGKGEGK